MQMNRREFIGTLAAATTAAEAAAQTGPSSPWGGPVLDCHLHLRADGAANIVHMDGCGVSNAVILTRDANRARALQSKYPSRLAWAASADVTSPDAAAIQFAKSQGADKLTFGSDCSCADGKGGGTSQSNNPAAARMSGKCVARETLTLLRASTTHEVFRKLTWDNGRRVYKVASA